MNPYELIATRRGPDGELIDVYERREGYARIAQVVGDPDADAAALLDEPLHEVEADDD